MSKKIEKIYSRPRIHLPKIFVHRISGYGKNDNKKTKRRKKIIKIFIIVVIAFSTVKIVLDAIFPIFTTLCKEKAKSIATTISNEQTSIVMGKHTYDDLFTIEKDSSGNITMIKSNVGIMNSIISDITIKIQEEFNRKERENIKIALGSFTGFKLLTGKGPGIPIKISTVGTVETNLKSEFIEQGINQTLHRVYLEVVCEISILTPYNDITESITNQILIAENVIVGQIPNTYYNLEGINEDDIMEVME